ncbi:CD225/dispanin family protein [Thermogutta sp.]|uniref:CD225/dispanin family protein n=1 Tax=Thermogutta sp. TaxID=1962930 RepID=UPI003C79F6CA
MYCPKCGALNADHAVLCGQCGQALQNYAARQQVPPYPPPYGQVYQPSMYPKVPNYLPWAIVVTLFCCLPFGIVAIVYSVQANSLAKSGNYTEALKNAEKASFWMWLSFAIGLVATLAYLFLVVVASLAKGHGF